MVIQSGENDSCRIWKEIAPENWKLHTKKKKEKKTLERAKSECTNPFHFLVKHSDLAHRMPTPCPCSRVVTKKPFHKFVDLRDVFKPLPLNTDEKQLVVFPSPARSVSGLRSYKTRADIIRGAHDRSKTAPA